VSAFETGGIAGGMPDLASGQLALDLQPNGWWLLRIGRAKKTKTVWLSMEEADAVRDLLASKLPKATTTRARKPTTAAAK